jgi:hypothetical protein
MPDTTKRVQRVTLIVLDSVGCGGAPDAAACDDNGANRRLGPYQSGSRRVDNAQFGRIGPGWTDRCLGYFTHLIDDWRFAIGNVGIRQKRLELTVEEKADLLSSVLYARRLSCSLAQDLV